MVTVEQATTLRDDFDDDSLDPFGSSDDKAALQVDELALREARRELPRQRQAPPPKPPSLGTRLAERARGLLRGLGMLLGRALALALVALVSAAAVSYGLDPEHVLDEVALSRAEASLREAHSQVRGILDVSSDAPRH